MRKFILSAFLFFFSYAIPFAQSGNGYELTKIIFEGNQNISDGELYDVIKSKESPCAFFQFLNKFTSFGKSPVYFDSSLIRYDEKAIKSLYMSEGFFSVKIKAETQVNDEDMEVTLKYSIHEGRPVRFHKLTVEGLSRLPKAIQKEITNTLTLDSSAIYFAPTVENLRNKALTYLRDNGYMLAKAEKPLVKVDTLKSLADIFLRFTPGKRFKILDIKVNRTGPGKNLVSDELLKKIVNIKPGEYYNNYEITQAQIRLYKTNLFSSALVTAIVRDSVDSKVPLSINADVNKLHEIAPEVIMNNEDNAFNLGIGLGLTRKNFLGDARKFNIGISAASQDILNFIKNFSIRDTTFLGYGDLRATVEQPFLFGAPIYTKWESYFTLQKKRREYNSKILGSKLSFSFELPRYTFLTSLSPYFNYEDVEYIYIQSYIEESLRDAFLRRPGITTSQADSLVNYYMKNVIHSNKYRTTNAVLGANLSAVHTDNLLFPAEGYSLSAVLEDGNSIPYLLSKLQKKDFNQPEYLKVFFTFSKYFSLTREKKSVLAVNFKLGDIYTYRGNKANISLNQRFYSGGSNSIRGWGSRELVPKQAEIDLSAPNQDFNSVLLRGISPGGFFIFEGSFEWRKKLSENFGFATFMDYGNTWNSPHEFKIDYIAVALGFGVRFYTDLIPLRLDFGLKAYDPYDRRSYFTRINDPAGFLKNFQFHLGIGEAF